MTVRWLTAEQQKVWRTYLLGSARLNERLDADLHRSGLGLPEYEILVRLSEAPGRRMRMAALADSLSHSRSRVTHTVARMERAGLVTRVACVSDGRGVEARLSDKGLPVLEEAAHTHVQGVREHLVDLAGDDDFAAVGRVFDAVTDHLVSAQPGLDIR